MLLSRRLCVPEFKKTHGPHGGPPTIKPSSFVLRTKENALTKPDLGHWNLNSFSLSLSPWSDPTHPAEALLISCSRWLNYNEAETCWADRDRHVFASRSSVSASGGWCEATSMLKLETWKIKSRRARFNCCCLSPHVIWLMFLENNFSLCHVGLFICVICAIGILVGPCWIKNSQP